jgi:hypothetical protein
MFFKTECCYVAQPGPRLLDSSVHPATPSCLFCVILSMLYLSMLMYVCVCVCARARARYALQLGEFTLVQA